MNVYTYVVAHENKPVVSSATELNGGVLKAVQFSDAIAELEELKVFLSEIRDTTTDVQTKYSIDDFMN